MGIGLGEIMRRYGDEYQEKYGKNMLPSHRQAIRAIAVCRTEALGGNVYCCQACNEFEYKYHSCRNRNCPQCQHEQTQRWLEKQEKLLLPVNYFLLTFTLPSGLREVARANQKVVYDLLFRVTAEASQELAQDKRYVGGQLGLMGTLHTWTRDMAYHPHIHYLVPGGGMGANGEWIAAHWRRFLFPVKALSKLVRGKFRQALRKAGLEAAVPSGVWQQDWVVHCKPAGNGETVLKYLAPYVFHIAISNRRLLKLEDNGNMANSRITFSYRTTKTGENKTMTLSVEAFLQRFLQHVLPKGFVKVRYFGFLAAPQRKRLHQLNLHIHHNMPPQLPAKSEMQQEQAEDESPKTIICPNCQQPMRFLRHLPRPECRSP
jgi:hypothetical protein